MVPEIPVTHTPASVFLIFWFAGDKKKFKKERDFIGLKGDHLCMMTAEADVEEEEVRISDKVMRSVGSFNINTSLLDAHLYIMKKWLCDFIVHDRYKTKSVLLWHKSKSLVLKLFT